METQDKYAENSLQVLFMDISKCYAGKCLQRIRELEAEIRALRKQLGEKDEVIDILKKSVGILSKP